MINKQVEALMTWLAYELERGEWILRTDLVSVLSNRSPFKSAGRSKIVNETIETCISLGWVELRQEKQQLTGRRRNEVRLTI